MFLPISKKIKEISSKFSKVEVILVGTSHLFRNVLEEVQNYASSEETVMILGETGTGKTELAKALHYLSGRREFPFIHFDCGLLGMTLAEDELYGHHKGAFTGAMSDRIGLIEAANNGTFFIDEIGNLPLDLQTKFLQVIENKKVRRIGENTERDINVRFISATFRNLFEEKEQSKFREDLFYRLDVLNIKIPPLRKRLDDIQDITNYYLFNFNKDNNKKKKISNTLFNFILSYSWPGNVRELINFLKKSYFNAKNNVISDNNIPDKYLDIFSKKIEFKNINELSSIQNIIFDMTNGELNFWMRIPGKVPTDSGMKVPPDSGAKSHSLIGAKRRVCILT